MNAKNWLVALASVAALSGCAPFQGGAEGPCAPEKVTQLFNGKNLDGWYVWLNGRGRDNDPQRVFSVSDGLIKVSGREYGCITTEKEYRDYHLVVEYRFTGWLDEQRTKAKAAPDTGILFHSTGADGAFYGTWMASLEYNVVEGGTGDFWTVAPKDRPDVTLTCKVNPKRAHSWDPYLFDARSKETVTLSGNKRVIRAGRPKELKYPEWNVCELICDGETAECRLNGVVVNRAERVTPSAGRIQLQSEGSGVEFRKVEIRPIKRPAAFYIDKAKEIWQAKRTRLGNVTPEAAAAIDYLEGVIADADRLMLDKGEVASLWLSCAGKAQDLFLEDRFTKAFENALRLSPGCTNDQMVAARYMPHYRAVRAAKTFPLPEKELKFGQTLKSMGVVEKKTVHLKDYWNPTNVTAAFQKLVDDPEVTTIVVDAMPTPWYVSSVRFGPNVNGKRVLMKSGVKLMRDPAYWVDAVPRLRAGAILDVLGGKNIIIESDAAKPEDVLVAFYPNADERAKHNKREGASGLGVGSPSSRIDCSRNVVFRNFRVADTEEDGLAIGSNWRPCEEVYVENVILDSNYRQGTSPCSYYSLYFKGCKFINTHGGPPTAGVDVEPWADYLTTAVLYFIDCEFANNGGGGLLFATSTRDPILCHVKRCTFRPTAGSQINICARPSGYIAADARPQSNILVEDTTFESTGETLRFEPCPIYDMTLRNCVIRDARSDAAKARAKRGPAPICLSLNRPFGKPDLSDGIRPTIAFENVRIEGFEDSEPLGVVDEIGMLNIRDVFAGTVDWNGKSVDFSKVAYSAPDLDEPRTSFVDLKTLRKPAKVPAAGETMPVSGMELCFMGAWWLKNPNHSYYFWADKGRTVTFDFELTYPRYYTKFPTNTLYVTSTSGAEVPVGDVTKGTQTLTYVAPETGWHRFSPGLVLDKGQLMASGINWFVTNVKGAHFAWQADTESDSFAKFFLADANRPYRGYFEVPAGGRTCRLRLSFGPLELYDGAGNLRGRIGSDEYRGRHIFEIKPSTDKAEIWSFVSAVDPYTTRGLRFYAPLNGLWADSPEDLPCVFAEHFVPAKEAVAAKASVRFTKLDRSKLTPAQVAKLDAAVAARREFAAKREYVGILRHEEAKIERMRAGKLDDDAEHQIADISGNVILLKRIVKTEEIAAKETPEVLESAAFCQAFAPDVVGAKELGWPKGVIEYKDLADLVSLRDLVLKKVTEK